MHANPVHQSNDANRVVEPVGLSGESCTRRALVAAVFAETRQRAWRLNSEPIDEVQVAWYSQPPAPSWESGRRRRQRIANAYGPTSHAAAGYLAVAGLSALLGVLLVILNGS
jgi:hypothetical protein